MKRTFWQRLRFLWAMSQIVPTQFHTVGSRSTETGVIDNTEITLTMRDILQPDTYTREELFEMLTLIRREEERHNWKVPEPHRCTFCDHCSLVDRNGFCPVCGCSTHQGGLEDGYNLALGEDCK